MFSPTLCVISDSLAEVWDVPRSSYCVGRHLMESQALYARQKEEIDALFARVGKVPPAIINPPAVNLAGRRRRPTKSKSSKSSRTSSQGSKSPVQPGTLFFYCLLHQKTQSGCWSCVLRVCVLGSTTLSTQSAPLVYPTQQSFHSPSGLGETGSNPLLQAFKPSPSSENLYSAYTSDATLSAPSLCLPTHGNIITQTNCTRTPASNSYAVPQAFHSNIMSRFCYFCRFSYMLLFILKAVKICSQSSRDHYRMFWLK